MRIPLNPIFGLALLAVWLTAHSASAQQAQMKDLTHYSRIFGEERNYRIFLPPDYDRETTKRYPVIYFFHGWGQRFNHTGAEGGNYDFGTDYGGDTISAFVGSHDVIVVRWDGYNPRTPNEDHRRPYNIGPVETHRQFPLYFPEFVDYIDANYRTIADREHRATAGLSMGGFMSFWISGKYPHLVGSASNFMGSSEFFVGPNGFATEYRHTEMHGNYEGLRTRHIMGSRDFIRWYHRRMNAVWDFTRPHHEHEQFDWDHGTPGMAKTLGFHMAAFADPLPEPSLWHHADVYPAFDVWGYSVASDRRRPGFTDLRNVSAEGFQSSVRDRLPDGPVQRNVILRITTSARYTAGQRYRVTEVNLETGDVRRATQRADSAGRLHFTLTGASHEVGIAPEEKPLVRVAGWRIVGAPWAAAGKHTRVQFDLVNVGSAASRSAAAVVSTTNPDVEIRQGRLRVRRLEPGGRAPAGDIQLLVSDPQRKIVRLDVTIGQTRFPVEIPLFADAPAVDDFVVLDGSPQQLWERAVVKSEKVIGAGNGDGAANPGETIGIGIRDGDALRAVELFANDTCVTAHKQIPDYWGAYDNVGATVKISQLLIAASCPEGHKIPLFVRYQLPDKPEHVLKQAVVEVPVSGGDRTPPQLQWAELSDWNRLEAEILDAGRIRASATLTSGDSTIAVPLNDDGRDGDRVAGDGVFAGLAPNPASGSYSLTIVSEDEFGNAATKSSGYFRFEYAAPSPPGK